MIASIECLGVDDMLCVYEWMQEQVGKLLIQQLSRSHLKVYPMFRKERMATATMLSIAVI